MSTEISASGSFNYKFARSRHCRATMYYNPSWSPRRDSDDEFLLFSHRRHGGTLPYASGRNFARFHWWPGQAPKRTNDKLIRSTTSSKTQNVIRCSVAFTRMSNKYSSRGNKYLFLCPFKYVWARFARWEIYYYRRFIIRSIYKNVGLYIKTKNKRVDSFLI